MDLLSRFDFFSPDVMRNPYPYFAELRDKAPLHYDAKLKAHVLSRYEDVAFVLKNHALFSSTKIRIAGKLQEERASVKELGSVSNLVSMDPPVHTRLRGLVSRSFTPKQINAMEPRVRELSRELVAEMTSRSEFDFMDALASPLPVTIIAEMLGIDPVRRRDFKRWSDNLIQSNNATLQSGETPEEVIRSAKEMLAYMTEVAEARRREPRGDLISLLVQEIDGVAALTPPEVNSFTTLLLIAGNETTTNLLGNALTALIRNPGEYEAFRRDPSPAACSAICEETLRYDSPVIGLFRRTTQEVEMSGGKLPADTSVMVLLASANHDPRKFPEPERFDPTRDTHGLMSFGHGIHFCLGAPLSRLEAPVALRELMERAPRLGFSPRQPQDIDYGGSFFLRGPKSLWLQKN
ncbi:cytochrome P450 [Melittangium boletus]|uniref:Cytochrome P450 hydroxylase n=1 Tax=Melittangium boletus DSM 14713 TaxID=1294270 RepID=A0A250IRU9_9BACT|nr:cytochrome P450 [Melittangium boletus]ATB34469.1 cytochrome P450 hydroxylase [Melittangium boletus DSM 14713]